MVGQWYLDESLMNWTLSTAQIGSMVFPCMVNDLSQSTAHVRSMVFTYVVDKIGSVDSI